MRGQDDWAPGYFVVALSNWGSWQQVGWTCTLLQVQATGIWTVPLPVMNVMVCIGNLTTKLQSNTPCVQTR